MLINSVNLISFSAKKPELPKKTGEFSDRVKRLFKQAEEAGKKEGTPPKSEHDKRTDEQISHL